MTNTGTTTHETLPFSEDKQLAFIGHLLSNEKFFNQCSGFVTPQWFINPVVSDILTVILDFNRSYNRQPQTNEISQSRLLEKRESEFKANVPVFLKRAEDLKNVHGLDVVKKEIDEWFSFIKAKEVLQSAIESFRSKKIDQVWTTINEGYIQKTSSSFVSGAGPTFLDAPTRAENERYERIEQSKTILSYGVRYLDDALGGIIPNDLIVLGAKLGSGKCLGLGTPVLRYNGTIVPVEDVRTGDLLMGPDSKPKKVLGTTRGVGQLYRVNPVKGDSWVCNDVHVLTLVHTNKNNIIDIPINEFLQQNRTFQILHKQFAVKVDFAEQVCSLPLDPYFLGAWLGDGSKEINETGKIDGIKLTKNEPELLAYLRQYANKFGLAISKQDSNGTRCPTYGLVRIPGTNPKNPLLNLLREVTGNKILIPQDYLVASRGDRLQLLAGILDTDGHLSSNCYDFIQKSEQLAKQVAFLARSLGFKANVRSCIKRCQNNFKGTYWRLSISGDISSIPNKITRKHGTKRRQIKNHLRTGIKKIDDIGIGEYAGFELDGDGRFLLGDFTVTHNTSLATSIATSNARNGNPVHFFALEAEANEIERRAKYAILADLFYQRVPKEKLPTSGTINYLDWRMGRLEALLAPFEKEALDIMQNEMKNLKTLYRTSGDFGLETLDRHLAAVSQESSLIVIDHLHYIDTPSNENENTAYKNIIKKIRDACLKHSVPVIVVAHLRKDQGGARAKVLINNYEDFHGTSDVPKIATTCIMVAPAYGEIKREPHLWPTYVRPVKTRLENVRTRYTACLDFNVRNNTYENPYRLGQLSDNDSVWNEVAPNERPFWAKGAI